jgi:hypothetical protein
MNRNAGFSAGILALLAVVFHVATPNAAEKETPGRASEQVEKPKAAPKPKPSKPDKSKEKLKVEDFSEGPWRATRSFFGAVEAPKLPTLQNKKIDLKNVKDTQDCAAQIPCASDIATLFGLSADDDVESLLATIPDPFHTRLPLFTRSFGVQA